MGSEPHARRAERAARRRAPEEPPESDHITATSKGAFEAGTALPEGTVLAKTQYTDGDCTDLDRWTLMKKREPGFDPTAADWESQNLDGQGLIAETGKIGYCASCHTACNELVCSK